MSSSNLVFSILALSVCESLRIACKATIILLSLSLAACCRSIRANRRSLLCPTVLSWLCGSSVDAELLLGDRDLVFLALRRYSLLIDQVQGGFTEAVCKAESSLQRLSSANRTFFSTDSVSPGNAMVGERERQRERELERELDPIS